MIEMIRAFCCLKKFVPKGFSALVLGLYTCIKSLKMCIISDFEEIILQLAKRKGLSVVMPLPGAIYMSKKHIKNGKKKSYFKEIVLLPQMGKMKGLSVDIYICPQGVVYHKIIKIYTRSRCEVSVYRITGHLVYLALIKYP